MESTPSMVAVIIIVNIEKWKGEVQCYIQQRGFEKKVTNHKYIMNIRDAIPSFNSSKSLNTNQGKGVKEGVFEKKHPQGRKTESPVWDSGATAFTPEVLKWLSQGPYHCKKVAEKTLDN